MAGAGYGAGGEIRGKKAPESKINNFGSVNHGYVSVASKNTHASGGSSYAVGTDSAQC